MAYEQKQVKVDRKSIVGCASCGYPIAWDPLSEIATCPRCGIMNEIISQGVTLPTWLVAGALGLIVGVIAGPALLASTDEGAKWLAKKAREKLER